MTISRRTFVASSLAASAAASATAAPTPEHAKPSAEHLGSTELLEAKHPRIVELAHEITRSANSNVKVAVLLHDWVRDEIAFGIPSGFYETTATQTLDAKVGYCNTKVTLFQALLRARAIPSRMRMMDLSAQVLRGLFDPGSTYVDHAITEIYLEGRWLKVDSYVADGRLVIAATKKLSGTRMKAGFGIHLHGKSQWDGKSDNFIQCMDDGSINDYVLKDHGVFVDVADFYQRVPEARNRKTFINALAIRLGHSSINDQIQKVRDLA